MKFMFDTFIWKMFIKNMNACQVDHLLLQL